MVNNNDTASSLIWHCIRQRAGPLVKECRALRPRLRTDDTGLDRRSKEEIRRYQRNAVNRRQVDRLELRLALFGATGTHYTLTFRNDTLPGDFAGVRRAFRAFIARVVRWRGGKAIDYVYVIEGLHGDHRYHIHMVCAYEDLTPAEVRYLWRSGDVDDEPVLRTRNIRDPWTGTWETVSDGGFRRLAEYFNKERTDGIAIPIGRHPWSCSRGLNARLPPTELWRDGSGEIVIPDHVLWSRRGGTENDFGAYYYGSWIEGSTH